MTRLQSLLAYQARSKKLDRPGVYAPAQGEVCSTTYRSAVRDIPVVADRVVKRTSNCPPLLRRAIKFGH